MTEQLVREHDVTTQQQQMPLNRPADIKVPNVPINPKQPILSQQTQISAQSEIPTVNSRQTKLDDLRSDMKTSRLEPTGDMHLRTSNLDDIRTSKTQDFKTSDMRETMAESIYRPSGGIQQSGTLMNEQTANYSQITVIDKKLIVEKVNETHFETQYVQKTIPVSQQVQNEKTYVTAIQETRRVPVTKLIEVIEQVPIKVVEEVIEYKTIPVTKFEEVIEQVPVKKYVPRTEYKKVPITKLIERTENVSVKRVEEKIEYVDIVMTNPIQPQLLDTYQEQYSGTIQGSYIASSNVGGQVSGTAGTTGFAGATGTAGTSGFTGTAGTSGFTGTAGTTGFTGGASGQGFTSTNINAKGSVQKL
jgi:hypothetical protein